MVILDDIFESSDIPEIPGIYALLDIAVSLRLSHIANVQPKISEPPSDIPPPNLGRPWPISESFPGGPAKTGCHFYVAGNYRNSLL